MKKIFEYLGLLITFISVIMLLSLNYFKIQTNDTILITGSVMFIGVFMYVFFQKLQN